MARSRRSKRIEQAPLQTLADRINTLTIQVRDVTLEFCKALAEAIDRVTRETEMTFAEWSRTFLRKANGQPWSVRTLYTYAYYGRYPDKLSLERVRKIDVQRETRQIARQHFEDNANGSGAAVLMPARLDSVADQVNFLMVAWERASDEARHQFLRLVTHGQYYVAPQPAEEPQDDPPEQEPRESEAEFPDETDIPERDQEQSALPDQFTSRDGITH